MEKPKITARWKQLRDSDERRCFRAICGRSGCAGCLGTLTWIDPQFWHDGFDYIRALSARVAELANEERVKLVRLIATQSFPLSRSDPGWFEANARLALLKDLAFTNHDLHRLVSPVRDPVTGAPALCAEVEGEPEWIMFPDTQKRKTLAQDRSLPQPIFYGFPDTGYRISQTGKRDRIGRRLGRREMMPTDLPKQFVDVFGTHEANGQFPVPPCRIWCPVCNTLNDVNQADAFAG